nr:PREDICTED: metaxin-2-like isoform X1 [Bemisia tabaci]
MVSSNVLLDSIQIEIGGDNEWPNDAKLFQPYETEQILMPDSANCLAVQAFLQMANLKYETVYKANAAEMSPTGRVPFIKVGQYLVAELEPIVAFVQNKNISLTSNLTDAEKSDMRAYMSLINTVFGNAENYITWCDPETYSKVTKKRFGSIHPFPLNHILVWKKRSATIERMKALGGKTEQEAVLDDVDLCCQSLSDRLGDREFFFKSGPTELDALVFGHIFTIITTPLPNNQLNGIVRGFPNLIEHCKRIDKMFFKTNFSSEWM